MSTFGSAFRVTTYGESHCRSVGCIVDGVPPGMPLSEADIQPQMTRRRPGQSALTTPRNEKDRVEIQSGTEFGITLGTPIAMVVRNEDQRPRDYGGSTMDLFPRPSHADFTYLEKYGVKASSGGGRSSARETIGMFLFCVFLFFCRLHFWCWGPCGLPAAGAVLFKRYDKVSMTDAHFYPSQAASQQAPSPRNTSRSRTASR
jgi:hypothetical protein